MYYDVRSNPRRSIIAVFVVLLIVGSIIYSAIECPECWLSECERNGGTTKVTSTTTGLVNGQIAYLQTTQCEMPK